MTAAAGAVRDRAWVAVCATAWFLPLFAACGSGGQGNPIKTAFAEARAAVPSGASVAFRFPGRGTRATLYQLPELDEVAWRFEVGSVPVARAVGFASDEDLIYLLTSKAQLATLDLTSGRTRVVDTAVALATMGPEGTAFVVHSNGSVARIERRSVSALPDSFPKPPERLWVGVRQRLIAVVPGKDAHERWLEALIGSQPRIRQRIPAGPVALSEWGDDAAVATDSGVVVVDPSGSANARFLRVPAGARAVAYSPSAHRLYVATGEHTLLQVDRFELQVLQELALPGTAAALRVDPQGRYLTLRPGSGDSAWVVDAAAWRMVGTVAANWGPELPQVAPNGTMLVRRDGRVVALSPDSLRAIASVRDEDRDHWLLAAWDPRRPALEMARDTARSAVQQQPASGQLIYVQVSSTNNEAWASDAAQNLRRAGMNATVLAPDQPDEPYRVVLGPYPNREAAEEIRSRLQMPSWILTRDTTQHGP